MNTQINYQPRNVYRLTKQEINVLHLLVEGNSYKMIAGESFISFETVKTHIRNLYSKLEVSSGTGAVSKALRENLVGYESLAMVN